MQRTSYWRDYKCQTMKTSSYETIRALIFSKKLVTSVLVKIYDSTSGSVSFVLDSSMVKLEGNETRVICTLPHGIGGHLQTHLQVGIGCK